MKQVDLDRLDRLYGPYKKFPVSFFEYPPVDELLESIPKLIAELKAAREVVEASKEMIIARPNWSEHMATLILAAQKYDEVTRES